MATICVRVQESFKCLVPWTIFQTDDGITLLELFERIRAGRTIIVPSGELVSSKVEKVFIGKSKESLVVIDDSIHLSDVLSTFGQFIKYNVVISVSTPSVVSTGTTLVQPNVFTLLMQNSARLSAAARKPLPDLLPEKNNKDKLFNAIIRFLDKNQATWESGGDTHGTPFVRTLCNALWYIDGHHQTFKEAGCPIPPMFKGFTGYNKPEASKHRKRSAVNMDAKALRLHATSLKEFLMSSWIKRDQWKKMYESLHLLVSSIEKYVSYLAVKKAENSGINRRWC